MVVTIVCLCIELAVWIQKRRLAFHTQKIILHLPKQIACAEIFLLILSSSFVLSCSAVYQWMTRNKTIFFHLLVTSFDYILKLCIFFCCNYGNNKVGVVVARRYLSYVYYPWHSCIYEYECKFECIHRFFVYFASLNHVELAKF